MAEQSSPLVDLSSTLADIIAATAPQVVEVQSHQSLASGFFWRDGRIFTADEPLSEEGKIKVELHDGTVLDFSLVGRDPDDRFPVIAYTGFIDQHSPGDE